MATYMVEVNAKFMVRLEIEGSALAAEHYFLDSFKGVWGAMAYDQKAMKTDCFVGAMMHDELTTVADLARKLEKLDALDADLALTASKRKDVEDEIERLTKLRDELEEQYNSKLKDWCNTRKELNAKQPQ